MDTLQHINQTINRKNPIAHFQQLCRNYLMNEIYKPNIFLVPVRIFLGIGWLRAAIEKGFSET